MKFEVTKPGVYDKDGKRIPVGTVVNVDGDQIPANLINKGRVLDGERVAITNPAAVTRESLADMTKAGLTAIAEAHEFPLSASLKVDEMRAKIERLLFVDID